MFKASYLPVLMIIRMYAYLYLYIYGSFIIYFRSERLRSTLTCFAPRLAPPSVTKHSFNLGATGHSISIMFCKVYSSGINGLIFVLEFTSFQNILLFGLDFLTAFLVKFYHLSFQENASIIYTSVLRSRG